MVRPPHPEHFNRTAFRLSGILDASHFMSRTVHYDKRPYRMRNRIERMFCRLKDRRRGATRYNRCSKVVLSAITLAATVIF
ncbi:MAG: transposase [Dinoroseobacter sp.]|jgi:transposase